MPWVLPLLSSETRDTQRRFAKSGWHPVALEARKAIRANANSRVGR
jgi:hypothetical protein